MNTTLNATDYKHVVLADDDQDHALLFNRILQKAYPQHRLSIVHNGDDLLQLLQTQTPDLLFLDLHMPCKNGIECLQAIRSTPHLSDLSVVVYSSSSKMTDIQRSYVNQADLYMVKPFHTEHLHNALQAILSIDLKNTTSVRNHYFINNRFVPFTATGI